MLLPSMNLKGWFVHIAHLQNKLLLETFQEIENKVAVRLLPLCKMKQGIQMSFRL